MLELTVGDVTFTEEALKKIAEFVDVKGEGLEWNIADIEEVREILLDATRTEDKDKLKHYELAHSLKYFSDQMKDIFGLMKGETA